MSIFSEQTQSFAHVVKSLAPSGIYTDQLSPYQLGLFDSRTGKSVTTTKKKDEYFLAIGSPNGYLQTGPMGFGDVNNRMGSFKTMPFRTEGLKHLRLTKPQKARPHIGYIGWNGTNDCESFKFECGTTYSFLVRIYGEGLNDVFGTDKINNVFQHSFQIATDCCNESCTTCPTAVPARKYLETLVTDMNSHPVVSQLAKFDLVTDCAHPGYADKVQFTKFCVRGCNLSATDVYKVLPVGTKLKDEGSLDCIQEYSLWVEGTTAPADVVTSGSEMLASCDTCEAGYTLVPASYIYNVTIDNNNSDVTPAAQLAAVKALAPFGAATAAVKGKFVDGNSTYSVTMPTLVTEADLELAGLDASAFLIAKTPALCKKEGDTKYEWTKCDECYKVKKKVFISLKKDDCEAETLVPTELTEVVNGNAIFVKDSLEVLKEGDCMVEYVAEVYSECMEDGCDSYGTAKFSRIPGYAGNLWTDTSCNATAVDFALDCKVGIRATGALFEGLAGGCTFDPMTDRIYNNAFSVEIIYSQSLGQCKEEPIYYKEVQTPIVGNQGGQGVFKEVVLARGYRGEFHLAKTDLMSMRVMEKEGLKYGVDVNAKYFKVGLSTFKEDFADNFGHHHSHGDNVGLYSTSLLMAKNIFDLLNGLNNQGEVYI